MRRTVVRWAGRVAAVVAAGLVVAAGSVYPGNVGRISEFRAVVVAGDLLVVACASAVMAAVCLFAATPAARRRRPVVAETRRLLGHLACATCLLLAAGVCALWAASHRQAFGAIYYNGSDVDYAVVSQWNELTFGTESRSPGREPQLGAGDMNLNTAFPARRALRIPHAVFAVLFALPALAWIARCRRAAAADKRRERGLCPVCAYDLRATPEGCPECGTAGRPGRPAGFLEGVAP